MSWTRSYHQPPLVHSDWFAHSSGQPRKDHCFRQGSQWPVNHSRGEVRPRQQYTSWRSGKRWASLEREMDERRDGRGKWMREAVCVILRSRDFVGYFSWNEIVNYIELDICDHDLTDDKRDEGMIPSLSVCNPCETTHWHINSLPWILTISERLKVVLFQISETVPHSPRLRVDQGDWVWRFSRPDEVGKNFVILTPVHPEVTPRHWTTIPRVGVYGIWRGRGNT